jgi:hypothetical protein
MRIETWVRHFFHVEITEKDADEIGRLWVQCKWLMKQKGYKFD